MKPSKLIFLILAGAALAAVSPGGIGKHRGGAGTNSTIVVGTTPNTITVTDASGALQTNSPITIGRPFAQGEITNFAIASIAGTPITTQCDVKNRWPDGSLKFAIMSFIVPSIAANGSVTVSFTNTLSGNNTGFLAQSAMLDGSYNFDGTIQLTGTASHTISARAILTAAASCSDPGSDPDGGQFECSYWLKGPVVTAVILEDRSGRTQDVNTDNGTGNPLHPIFEAWFYPQTSSVVVGYALENSWASTTPANSARDQTYSVVLTGGNTSPVTEYSSSTITQITRTRWHKSFCVTGTGAGNTYRCGPSTKINYNWPYLASTKFTPNWDPALTVASTKISSEVSAFASTNQTLVGVTTGTTGVGFYPSAMDATGAGEFHGPLTTWDIITLISSDSTILPVTLANADLGNAIPYFYREADTNAGHGQTFDNSGIAGNVKTQGRVVSINARTQTSLLDATSQNCNTNFTADWINFGGAGQNAGVWGTANLDTSHWPNLAYTSYLLTGQYAYYEEQVMQSAYAVAASPGSRACTQPTANSSLRMASAGYWYVDQERGTDWQARDHMLGTFIAVDGSPEAAYFLDKLKANIAVWEGIHSVTNDVGAAYATAWTYGNTSRVTNLAAAGTPLGAWTHGPAVGTSGYAANYPICYQTAGAGGAGQCPTTAPAGVASDANSNFQTDYSAVMIGWLSDLGYCTGNCAILGYVANHFINYAQNPTASIYDLGLYVFPTLDNAGAEITTWSNNAALYFAHATSWDTSHCVAGSFDEDYGSESISALSYFTNLVSSQGGYSGATAYSTARSGYPCNADYATLSPKWDIVPRTTTSTNLLSPAAGWHKIPSTAVCGGGAESNPTFVDPNNFPNNLNAAYTSYGYQFAQNCINLLEDSNSGAYDTKRHRLIMWGGGHQHYWGNDVVSLELTLVGTSAAPMYHLDHSANPVTCPATGPASTTVTESNGAICLFNSAGALSTVLGHPGCNYATGCTPSQFTTPASVHTYNGLMYIPGYDVLAEFGGATAPNGNAGQNAWVLAMGSVLYSCAPNTTTNQQGCDPQYTFIGNPASNNAYVNPLGVGVTSAYDPNTNGVWLQNQSGLEWFDPSSNTLTVKTSTGIGYHSIAVLDPLHKYYIMVGPSSTGVDGLRYINVTCSNPPTCTGSNFAIVAPTTTGCTNLIGGTNLNPQYMGVAWDPVGKRVAIYPNAGNLIWYIDPTTWTCTSETYGSTQGTDYPQNTPMPGGNGGADGTFGHFQYDPSFDVFVLCNDPNNDCWYLRLNR